MFLNTEIGKLVNRAKKIQADDIFVKVFSINGVQLFASQLNRDQLKYGFEDSNGVQLSDIGGDYSPFTIQLSASSGKPKKGADKVDLHDTGAFHKSIKVTKVDGTGFIIDGETIKEDGTDLESAWGKDILGLNEKSLSKLIDTVIPIYQNAVLKYLQNG